MNDARTGKGSLTWKMGDKYVGDYLHGKRTGVGTFYWSKTGDRYEGTITTSPILRLARRNFLSSNEWL